MTTKRTNGKKIPRSQKLTKVERHLIEHPPTEKTWLCPGPHISDKGVIFEIPNSGSSSVCWHCRRAKPKKVKLVWKDYEQACKKAGIDPGTNGSEARRTLLQMGYSE